MGGTLQTRACGEHTPGRTLDLSTTLAGPAHGLDVSSYRSKLRLAVTVAGFMDRWCIYGTAMYEE